MQCGLDHRRQRFFGAISNTAILSADIMSEPFGRSLQHSQHGFHQGIVHRVGYDARNEQWQ